MLNQGIMTARSDSPHYCETLVPVPSSIQVRDALGWDAVTANTGGEMRNSEMQIANNTTNKFM